MDAQTSALLDRKFAIDNRWPMADRCVACLSRLHGKTYCRSCQRSWPRTSEQQSEVDQALAELRREFPELDDSPETERGGRMKIEEARYISFAPADSRCGESVRISGVVIAKLDGKPPGIFYQLTHDDGTVTVVSVDDPTGWVHDPAGNRISSDRREAESPSAAEAIQQGLMAAVARLVGRVQTLERRADLEQKCSLVRLGMSAAEVDRIFAKSDETGNGTAKVNIEEFMRP